MGDTVIPVRSPDPDMEKRVMPARDTDMALEFLRREDGDLGVITEMDEKALLRKIDFMVVPLMFACYLLQYIDKILINYANVMGIRADAKMTASQFSYLALAFYVSYLVCEIPQGWLMQRFPTAKYLGLQVILWGICVAMNCICKNFASLIVVRVLLGAFEAAVAPALILITGMWYKKSEQPTRIGIWYLGTGIGKIVGSLSSFGFQFYTGTSFKSWQIMFLVFGIITITVGILVILFLPDNPMASRLTQEEKVFAIERLRGNKTGIENKVFKTPQMWECLRSTQAWTLCLLICSLAVSNGAISTFSSTIIKGLGYTSKQSALLNIPAGAIEIVSILSASYVAGCTNTRILNVLCLLAPAIIGGSLLAFLPKGYEKGKLVGNYMTTTIGPTVPLLYSLCSANFAGHTKKVTMNALLLMAFCLGNIIGPLTFTGETAPVYFPAKVALVATASFSALLAMGLWVYLVRENSKRDEDSAGAQHIVDSEFMDLTDVQNKEFRYSL